MIKVREAVAQDAAGESQVRSSHCELRQDSN